MSSSFAAFNCCCCCYLGNLDVVHELAGGDHGVRVMVDSEGMEFAVAGAVVGAGSLPQAGKAAHEGGKSEIGLG